MRCKGSLCWLALGWLSIMASAHSGEGANAPLRLAVQTDSKEYLVGQAVLLHVSVANVSSEAFRDLTIFHPAAGSLGIELERDGISVPWSGMRWTLAMDEGITLFPGESVCEVYDLTEYYGEDIAVPDNEREAIRTWCLRPGTYRMHVTLSCRTGVVPGLAQVVLDGGTMAFHVRDVKEIGKADRETLRGAMALKRLARSPYTSTQRRILLLQNLRSPYLFHLFNYLHLKEDELPTSELVGLLEEQGTNPVLAAEIVHARCQLLRVGDREKARFVDSLKRKAKLSEVLCVLGSWQVKLRNRRFYTSFGS